MAAQFREPEAGPLTFWGLAWAMVPTARLAPIFGDPKMGLAPMEPMGPLEPMAPMALLAPMGSLAPMATVSMASLGQVRPWGPLDTSMNLWGME